MKRIFSAVFCAAILLSLMLAPAQAAGEQETARKVAIELGIIPAEQTDLSRRVTRGEFSKMLVKASVLKGMVSPVGNSSPYKDVPHTDPNASYIKTAVQKKWVSGYLDGSFRPNIPVSAAEAASAVLALLNYGADDFSGSYPEGQLALYQSLGLNRNIYAGAADSLTANDCINLFYNLLDIKAKDGEKKYAELLGYKLDKNGKPDTDSILRTAAEGPYVISPGGWKQTLPFTPATVYRNDTPANTQALQPWDVIYYSKSTQTVWAYARRVSGTLEKVSPNRELPETVTVAGVEYKLNSDMAKNQLGISGGLSNGTVVTLLIGRNGEAAAAYHVKDLNAEIIGAVTASGTASYTAANGASYEATTLSMLGVDGQTYTLQSSQKYSIGSLVRASFASDGVKISSLSRTQSVSGRISAAAGKIGQTPIADGVQILDVSGQNAVKAYLSRLDGITLSGENVLYSEKNTAGEIAVLILKDVTGDQYSYGILLSAKESSVEMSLNGTYRILANGQENTYNLNDRLLNAQPGPVRIDLKDGQLNGIRALTELKNVERIAGMTLKAGNEVHTIWDNAAAFVKTGGQYRKVDRNELNPAGYTISAFYDAADDQGGRVRVLIAVQK